MGLLECRRALGRSGSAFSPGKTQMGRQDRLGVHHMGVKSYATRAAASWHVDGDAESAIANI